MLDGQMLVVDFGRIYQDGTPIGVIYDDGYLQNTSGVLGNSKQLRPIEAIEGCTFQGIDSEGMELKLPCGPPGPSGSMKFNGVLYHVVNGRIAAPDHSLVGEFTDEGKVFVRDQVTKVPRRELDETTQMNTLFDGKRSDGQNWRHEWVRPLTRRDKPYSDAQVIRYFMDYDKLNGVEKKFLFENMKLWSACGMVQVVMKEEGNCALGNVKHGAAGQTGIRTGNVTLDREELDRDIKYYGQFGPFANFKSPVMALVEVRLNLVVAHEYGHQLEFCLSQATQEKVKELYRERRKACDKTHPLPEEYRGDSELIKEDQVARRHFITGYARASFHEYWAECAAAFSIKRSREILKRFDPAIYNILHDVIFQPKNVLRTILVEPLYDLQASLRMGGEFFDDLLDEEL